MGIDGTSERIMHLSKTDLITVLESIVDKLEKVKTEIVSI